MPRIAPVDHASAEGAQKEILDAIKAKVGMVPNLFATLANQPTILKAYLDFADTLGQGNLSAKEREAIALTTAGANSCDYCASAHVTFAKMMKVDDSEIEANLKASSADAKLNAALTFANAVVEKRGFVSDEDLAAVRAAGHDEAAIMEIIGNVVVNIFTNYVNHIAQTDIDFPVVETQKKAA